MIGMQMFKQREQTAAVRIQAAWRRYKTQEWYRIITQLRIDACIRIQRNWKLIKFLKMGPKIRKAKRDAAATIVQKYLKGYLTSKHALKHMAETKIGITAAFFQTMRDDLVLSAQIVIAYHWRRYTKLKRREEAFEREMAAKNKTKIQQKPPRVSKGGNPLMKRQPTVVKKPPVVTKPVAAPAKEPPSSTFLTSADPQASVTKKEDIISQKSSARPIETESNKQALLSEKVIEEEDFEEYALGTMNNSAQKEKQGLGEDIDVVTD